MIRNNGRALVEAGASGGQAPTEILQGVPVICTEKDYSFPQLPTFDHVQGSSCSDHLNSPFLSQSRWERVIYLKRKPYHPLFDRSFKIGRIFCHRRPQLAQEWQAFKVRNLKKRFDLLIYVAKCTISNTFFGLHTKTAYHFQKN